jgi:hypothetical protein
VDDTRSREVGAGDETHEWAKTGCGQGSREVEPRYVGFEVVIENRSTTHHLEFGAQGRAEVGEPTEVETEPSGSNDVICALGDLARGPTQAELDAVADRGSLDHLVAKQHRNLALDALA